MLGIISLKEHIHTFCVSNAINTTNPKEHKNLDSWLLPRLWPGLWKKHPAMIFSQSNNVNKWFSLISHFFFKIKKIQEIVFFSFCLCVIHSFWSSFARCLIWLVFLVPSDQSGCWKFNRILFWLNSQFLLHLLTISRYSMAFLVV